jgi:hypothetical protein
VTEPEIVADDNPRRRHLMWAMWPEDRNGDGAHMGFWRTRDGRIVVKSLVANADVRGRAMLRWLTGYGLPVHVVEVIPTAMGFWDCMVDEQLVADWDPSDGFASPLESLAVPLEDLRCSA